ncbi:MAG: family 43 glycosylhydrolase [Verrucomicrobia bacterium]|jgi:hypothetical protein|nr:family 43 glycosylhydrolase [Verrucomicrobiota bacterium]OQC68275.1 MAG: Arabinoxylan arabinofuranohydrolase precursor [Verrucomicrobia bacterium ADurb.Bin006]HOA63114.1 family 43 glycosylhydrolase [Verrucomicrobiota bacterium]HOF50027.1 family 43 glycosylhydrolase [Verrucomicrobiota bacterium]HOG88838.1 family 43 glycosylhydrolase [Verrucomicrobiota bacterium]
MNSLGLPRPAYNRLLSASHAAAIAAVIAVMAHTTGSRADDSGGQADTFDAPGNCNPIVPGYFADPTIKQFGDTFYLYATTDGNGGGRGPATVWVSRDFVHWVLVPMNWPATPHYWAPDVVRRPDGRYYLFYNQPCNTFAGVSDSPTGPWTPLTPGDGLVIPDRLVKDVITLDTQFFEDKDGTLYGYWGTWGIFANSGCGYGVFNPDMKSFARLGMIPNTQAKDFFEAPFMLERNGVYYFTYSSGSCHDASYRVQYAVSNKPDGEFKMGPNNPILATTPDGKVHGPGHHSILRCGNDDFIVYHRHDIPVTPNGMHRQTCADKLVFASDGVIEKVVPTHRGIGFLGPQARGPNLALAKTVTASSHYLDTLRKHSYKPEYAVDDNNATLWRPADNRMGHWLTVDLGSPQRIRRTETQFEYATWFYQYLIETSLDGQTWTTFADRRQNTRWGSPMVDDGDVQTRYLRLTVTGTEFLGLFGAIWNFKAYADAPADSLLTLANQAFENLPSSGRQGRAREAVQSAASRVQSEVSSGRDSQSASIAPIIHLDVADLQLGAAVAAWTNHGTLGGTFTSRDAQPAVDLASGRKAVRFAGKELLTASFPSPRALSGNSSFTVAAWVNNPEIAESECFLSWAGRGGPDAATAQFGYGTQPEFGAVGHWGFADLGFRGGPPEAGQWHHLAVVFDGVIERLYVNGQLNNAEAKMLLMHQGRPVYVGASEPGTEHFDGYLASLSVYTRALSETEIKELAANEPSADVLVHLDAAKLDYGPLESWPNHGALGGTFTTEGPTPVVDDFQGRIAVRLAPSQSLSLTLEGEPRLGDFTLLASLANPGVASGPCATVEFEGADATRNLLSIEASLGAWRLFAVVFRRAQDTRFVENLIAPNVADHAEETRDGTGTLYLDAEPVLGSISLPPERVKSIRLTAQSPLDVAISDLQIIRRALPAAEIRTLTTLTRQKRQTPSPNPAAFAQPPTALEPTLIAMTAQPGQSRAGRIEYCFTETTGQPGGTSSGWTPHPFFLDDALEPATRYAYTVKVRDASGNVTAASIPLEADTDTTRFQRLSDRFDAARDFLAQGVSGTVWDGFLGPDDSSAPEAIRAQDGVLRLQSKGTVWDGGKPLGAFLYKLVPGDFVAQVRVADYAGLDTRRVPGNNDGGLMVRLPEVAEAGPGEDLLQLNFFPIWNQGNMITILDGGRRQMGNGLAWNAHRHLQIIRCGSLFWFRTSPDGALWQNMPGSPVERPDMAGQPLQVGLYHASYGNDSSHIAFADFKLTVQ